MSVNGSFDYDDLGQNYSIFDMTINSTTDYHDVSSSSESGNLTEGPINLLLDPLYVDIGHYLIFVVSTPLAIFGCFANVANVIIFTKQGRKDCVSVCLFSLSVSDFLCCFTVLIFDWVYIANFLENYTIIEPLALDVTTSYISAMFYDISQGITAFISLQRCLCVAMPLKFKNMFTVKRSVILMVAMYVLTCLAYTPHYRTCGLYTKVLPNATITALWESPDRAESIFWLNYILHISVETIYQIVVVVSACVMIMGLRRSSKFREKKAKVHTTVTLPSQTCFDGDESQVGEGQNQSQPAGNGQPAVTKTVSKKKSTKEKSKNPNKNRNVAKTIFALALMAIICNTERLIAVYGQRFVPGLTFDGEYRNFFFLTVRVTFLCSMVNSSTNVLVYLSLNPSYRRTFVSIFCCQDEEKNSETSK